MASYRMVGRSVERGVMKVLKKANSAKANEVNAQGYEFKLCGGSVEPKDRKEKEDEKAVK